MKKQILLFVLTLLPMLASAETVEIDGIWYVIKSGSNNTGVTKSPNYNYTGDIVIPSSITYNGVDYEVTSIVDGEYGNGAFESCNITSISLPNTIKRIGKRAFVYCFNIKSIDIPYGVTSIGEAAFFTSGLSSVTIPSSVTTIERAAFRDCSHLESVYISDLTTWCNISFDEPIFCGTMADQFVAHHLYLNGDEIKELVIPQEITTISSFAFEGCSGLTSVTIPNSVTSIGSGAFGGCI